MKTWLKPTRSRRKRLGTIAVTSSLLLALAPLSGLATSPQIEEPLPPVEDSALFVDPRLLDQRMSGEGDSKPTPGQPVPAPVAEESAVYDAVFVEPYLVIAVAAPGGCSGTGLRVQRLPRESTVPLFAIDHGPGASRSVESCCARVFCFARGPSDGAESWPPRVIRVRDLRRRGKEESVIVRWSSQRAPTEDYDRSETREDPR